jgi:hypothetical protein
MRRLGQPATKFGSRSAAIKSKVKTVEIHPTFTDDQKAAAGLNLPQRFGELNLKRYKSSYLNVNFA